MPISSCVPLDELSRLDLAGRRRAFVLTRNSSPMRRITISLLAACLVSSCSTRTQDAQSVPEPAVLRLLEITPRDGTRVSSDSVLIAKLAYHIPDFDSTAIYTVSAVFAQEGGGMFNRGGGHAQLRSPTGIVTLRHSLDALLAGDPGRVANPLTGNYFLFQIDRPATTQDTFRVGDQVRIRSATVRSAVRAQSRTFHFNGAGPVRSLASDLPELLEEYWTYSQHKALAVAYDSASQWTYGYAYGFSSPDSASEHALTHCRAAAERRSLTAPCRLIAIDDQGTEAG